MNWRYCIPFFHFDLLQPSLSNGADCWCLTYKMVAADRWVLSSHKELSQASLAHQLPPFRFPKTQSLKS